MPMGHQDGTSQYPVDEFMIHATVLRTRGTAPEYKHVSPGSSFIVIGYFGARGLESISDPMITIPRL